MSSTFPRFNAIVLKCRARVLAALAAREESLDLIENAVKNACEHTLSRWTESTLAANPADWLYQVAYRLAIDIIRREQILAQKRALLMPLGEHNELPVDIDGDFPDERLRLIFTWCHPALAQPARVRAAPCLVLISYKP